MNGQEQTYIQCQSCGHLYTIQKKIPISASMIKAKCPKCGYERGLNCGDKEEDIPMYYNVNLDPRYYE